MNKLIKELIKQATTVSEPDDPDYRHETFDKKKYAELIIKECIDIAENLEDQLEATNLRESNAAGIVAYRIARHFGVK